MITTFSQWAGDLPAGMAIIKSHVQETLVYRFDLVIGLVRALILVGVFRYLWLALYTGRPDVNGASLAQTLAYAALSLIINPLFSNWLIGKVANQMRTGNIIFDVTRPSYFGDLLLYQTVGQALVKLITTSIPLFVIVTVWLRIALPDTPVVWLGFAVSLVLSFLTAFYIDYLASLWNFWVTNASGMRFAKWSITDFLAGVYLPLWIFPAALQQVVLLLPFRGINYTPLAIFTGYILPDRIWPELAFQLVWVVVLMFVSRRLYVAAMRKLSVQGG